ncbi:MAG: restriction endonuclease [Sulfobacillus sp.]
MVVVVLTAQWVAAHPLALLGVVAVVVLIFMARSHASAVAVQRLRLSGIATIDNMSGVQFERRLAQLFADLGYRVRGTKTSGDYGADLLINKPGQMLVVVQSKCYSAGHSVGVGAIQEVLGAMGFYGAGHGLVVTNRTYTEPARHLAAANKVTLWDRSILIDQCAQVAATLTGEKHKEDLATILARPVRRGLRSVGGWVSGAGGNREMVGRSVSRDLSPQSTSATSWQEKASEASNDKLTGNH